MSKEEKQEVKIIKSRWQPTPRTENIIGALVIIIGTALILAGIGYAIPNYIVYYKSTVSMVGTCN